MEPLRPATLLGGSSRTPSEQSRATFEEAAEERHVVVVNRYEELRQRLGS